MDALDPDDPRPPYIQVANNLRAAILTRKFTPGEKLPSGPQLADRYGVARMTIQQAIRVLRDEGLIVSRQGSGVFVRERTERPVGLRPHIERAFGESVVTIDFAGFSGETLHGAIAEPIDKIRDGRLRPDSLQVRLLVPDASKPWALPARVDDLTDSPDFRQRATRIMERHALAVVDAVNELVNLGLISSATAEVRTYPAVPLFKLYILNGTYAFFGYYPVQEHSLKFGDETVGIWDLMGKDTTLFEFSQQSDPDARDAQFVRQSQMWFESIWTTVAEEYHR
ncbi:GntR family transcriptional regulator [Nocardia sp. NEAU-G5]|uniref:GntR family transcriptional regulator n=1 Tax=Nocardia albiluteola TaxID=2842303 RepID=A0ABS6B3L8_9NOCA|nr:GntR family transcriptional regulator [Nocardia albiluteola]MBU3064365.1 GntR family transcriptional regulator [Nocardia albiluteola]